MRFDQLILTEAKARIDHPEDLIFDQGINGAVTALHILKTTADHPNNISIKFDGSPALIAGRDQQGFTLTDKSGFNNKLSTGLPRSREQLTQLLYSRFPDQPGRANFAATIGGLWSYFEQMIPSNFNGFLQCDLMWSQKPPVIDGFYQFRPNKILYKVSENSELGRLIATSQVGIVLHSQYQSRGEPEPRAISDISSLKLNPVPGLVILDPKLSIKLLHWPQDIANRVRQTITREYDAIAQFFNPVILKSNQISDLQSLMKKYVNSLVRQGTQDYTDAAAGFIDWIVSDQSKISYRKAANIKSYVMQSRETYQAIWSIVQDISNIKMSIKQQLDKVAERVIHAELYNVVGQEGFVSDTQYGKVKFVERSHFMKDASTF